MYKKLTLENSDLKIIISPELGGRVLSLFNKKKEFEWVWNNKNLIEGIVPKGTNYDDNWQGGWEELFPNDAIEKFSWGTGYDHGETWSHAWKVNESSNKKIILETSNLDSGSKICKTYSLNGNKLRVEYCLRVSFKDIFLFKLHIAIPIYSRCNIKGNFSKIKKVEDSFGNILETEDITHFLNLENNSKFFDFGYVENEDNHLSLHQENNSLKLTYDKEFLNYLWIFQSQGGWMGHNVLVLEPASNGKKLFKDAIYYDEYKKGPMSVETYYEVCIT